MKLKWHNLSGSAMTIIIRKYNLLFTGIPGAASTSVEKALEHIPGAEWLAEKHTTVDDLIAGGKIDINSKSDLDILCIVRNPYDMLHAEWFRSKTRWVLSLDDPNSAGTWPREKRKQIMMSAALDFSSFIHAYYGIAYENGTKISIYDQYTKHATYVGKLEDLKSTEDWVSKKTQREFSIPSVNKSERRIDYWRDYDALARRMVSAIFKDDIEQFGYSF